MVQDVPHKDRLPGWASSKDLCLHGNSRVLFYGTKPACAGGMNTAEIVLIALVIGILAVDVAVRLVIAPHGKDRFVLDLLDLLREPGSPPEAVLEPPSTLLACEGRPQLQE